MWESQKLSRGSDWVRRLYNPLCYGLPPGGYWTTNYLVMYFAPEDSAI